MPVTSPPPTVDSLTDRVLVARYVSLHDEIAFAALVRRHSSLILGICHRVLGHRQDVEDAFQATFLVLARDAHRVRKRESLASWLHGVAYRTSLRAAQSRHRRIRLLQDVTMIEDRSLADVELRHQRQLLDEELENLPEKYRAPLILYYLEGQTAQQVAQTLKLSTSTVEGRLKRGRKELHLRLVRRGLGLSIAVAALAVTPQLVTAAETSTLVGNTIHAGLSYTAGDPAGPLFTHEAARLDAQETLAMTLTTTTATVTALILIPIAVGMSNHGAPSGTLQVETAPRIMTALDERETSPPILLAQAEETVEQETSEADPGDARLHFLGIETPIKLRPDRAAVEQETQRDREPQAPGRMEHSGATLNLLDLSLEQTAHVPEQRRTWHHKRQSENEQRIEAELIQNTEFDFIDTPLSEATEYIGTLHNIVILTKEKQLSDEGVATDTPISLIIHDVKLESALDLMLEPLELDYVIENEVMQITTREDADSHLETRVYDLPAGNSINPDQLIHLVQSSVTGPWEETGGECTVTLISHGLVIRHNQRGHREVEALFEQLEQHAKAEGAQPGPETFEQPRPQTLEQKAD